MLAFELFLKKHPEWIGKVNYTSEEAEERKSP